jgi:MSHA pilin protein MshD
VPPRSRPALPRRDGFSLIEMVIAIVVLAAAATAILSAYVTSVASSADPQVRVQAQAIAVAYMDEIMLQAFDDPDTGDTGSQEESDREDFDDIWDYQNIDEDPTDRNSPPPIDGLTEYNVTVNVTELDNITELDEDSSPGDGPAEIEIVVTKEASDVSYTLKSLREDY